MYKMYYNLAKNQGFPIIFRVSSKPRYAKPFHTPNTQSLPIGFCPKSSLNPMCVNFTEMGNIAMRGSISSGSKLRNAVHCCTALHARSFFSSCSLRVGEGSLAVKDGKSLPWLSSSEVRKSKRLGKFVNAISNRSSWEESANRLEKGPFTKTKSAQSWNHSVESALEKNSEYVVRKKLNRNRMAGDLKEREYNHDYNERNVGVEDEVVEEELDVVDDPRWDKIKNRFKGMSDMKGRNERPDFQRWNKQESWGRKTWREASESTIPKMVGEGVYGVGPVLAALSAGRREFYVLYVQEGLDLSSNNKKKKDKKGFEKVLKMAQKIGLSIKEVSKHDLNMVADNRPHQGLVLDASPLEMVKIKELDPVSPEDDKGSVWIALDEVTDPQNLGAIIRSAYFFGVTGVVLCAKNSAPLSGVVSKASAGSLEIMELRYCKNMMQFLVSSAGNGWRVLGGSVSSKAVPLNKVLPGKPTILVLGSEGTGLRPLVERSCTQLVRIPGNILADATVGGNDDLESEETNLECSSEEFQSFLAVESLNVSVAAGVLLHHLTGSNRNDEVCTND